MKTAMSRYWANGKKLNCQFEVLFKDTGLAKSLSAKEGLTVFEKKQRTSWKR
jgi:hypothetical protein